jgi:hypothetical protein
MGKSAFERFLVRVPAGERIFTEGDAGTTMYIVQSGKVRLYRETEGSKRTLGEMQKGDFFSEMTILEGLPRTTSAEAVDDVELIEINSTTFDRMIKGNIEIAVRLLRKLSIKLRAAEQRIQELEKNGARPPATQRTTAAPSPSPHDPECSGLRLEPVDEGPAFAVNAPETLVGRFDPVTELKPDVDLSELDLKRSVSRRHARIIQTDEGFEVVEEVGALNGTFVNGEKLTTGQPHPLSDGDELGLGMVKLVFRT